jgi:GMP synthase-like glutamine amidotransferase
MRTIHCIQHVPYEPPAHIATWAERRDIGLSVARVFADEPLPAPDDIEGLVVMGGPMGVADAEKLPWMLDEQRLIEAVLHAGKPVMGVCLGAQLVARVLGARVHRNRFQEIGWFRVEATAEGRDHARFPIRAGLVPFHWHGDTFDLPRGAVHLARSAGCEQQAFAWGDRVLALQFHLEVASEEIGEMIEHCRGDIGTGPYVQSPAEMLATTHVDAAHAFLDELLDRWREDPSHEDT